MCPEEVGSKVSTAGVVVMWCKCAHRKKLLLREESLKSVRGNSTSSDPSPSPVLLVSTPPTCSPREPSVDNSRTSIGDIRTSTGDIRTGDNGTCPMTSIGDTRTGRSCPDRTKFMEDYTMEDLNDEDDWDINMEDIIANENAAPKLSMDSPQYEPQQSCDPPQYEPQRSYDSPQYEPQRPYDSPQYEPQRSYDSPQYSNMSPAPAHPSTSTPAQRCDPAPYLPEDQVPPSSSKKKPFKPPFLGTSRQDTSFGAASGRPSKNSEPSQDNAAEFRGQYQHTREMYKVFNQVSQSLSHWTLCIHGVGGVGVWVKEVSPQPTRSSECCDLGEGLFCSDAHWRREKSVLPAPSPDDSRSNHCGLPIALTDTGPGPEAFQSRGKGV